MTRIDHILMVTLTCQRRVRWSSGHYNCVQYKRRYTDALPSEMMCPGTLLLIFGRGHPPPASMSENRLGLCTGL